MKKLGICALLLTTCVLAACDQNCPMTGSPNTTYVYSYTDSGGTSHFGSFTTNANGNAEIADVPSGVDCSKITFREDAAFIPEAPPQA